MTQKYTGLIKHGACRTAEYKSWTNLKTRCYNPNVKNYHRYGGRGIRVCERWINSFANFISDMGPCPAGMSINRKDNDKDYGPDNCEWADEASQQNNRNNNVVITHNSEALTISQWSRRTGISESTIRWRFRSGWSPIRILNGFSTNKDQT